ncbi:MAG: YncE family protein [Polyangiaceae bacterium]
MRRTLLLVALFAVGCSDGEERAPEKRSLSPYPNPFGAEEPLYAPQPRRQHPLELALDRDGDKLYVTLQGVEDEPGHQVAVVDTASERLLQKIEVGSGPTGLALHPGGRFLVVTNRFSNFASVIDTAKDEVVREVSVPWYTIDVAFTPDGKRAYFTNRWKDSVLYWDLEVGESFRVVGDNYRDARPEDRVGIPVGDNPRDLALSPDGSRLFVASLTGLTLSVIDTQKDVELERVELFSPPGDVVASDGFVFVTHTGRGSQHRPDEGFDTDGDGKPGDGTANVMFQDLQNEIAVLDHDGKLLWNYTSDTTCCRDYRDVDPDHPEKGAALPPPDSWPASRIAYLAPKDTWLVACALPEQMHVSGSDLLVACSGSNEVQAFRVGKDGKLSTEQSAGKLFRTGMNPYGVVAHPDGKRAFAAERLGEYVSVLDLEAGPGTERRILVGDVRDGEFPASDAEIGEGINFVTAGFTVDGDQTCAHCHREGNNIAKPVAMPLQTDPAFGSRMVMAYRGAFDTRPWFFETAMDESNFFPVINEFSRKENFCCEELDPLIWKKYPSVTECQLDPKKPGCNHVLDCRDDPPPECKARTYGSPHGLRNAHFKDAAKRIFGRDYSFGDGLFQEYTDATGQTVREGIALDFSGVTRALGLLLLQRPRFLPNPNQALDLPAARRGHDVYTSPQTGCNTCHPLPLTTVSATFNPSEVPLRFPPVVTPTLNPNTGKVADTITQGFVQTFPLAVQNEAGIHFGVPQLRGVWDRARRFYHDGRARSLREALATPGHPSLAPGEVGHNETRGMRDTHGATGHLSAEQLSDLIAFLEAL